MNLPNSATQLGLFGNTGLPAEGAKSVGPINLDWSTKGQTQGYPNSILVNLRAPQTLVALMSQALSMFVGNRGLSQLKFTFGSGQVIYFPAGSNGYLPIAQGNPIEFSVENDTDVAGITQVTLFNTAHPPAIWTVS